MNPYSPLSEMNNLMYKLILFLLFTFFKFNICADEWKRVYLATFPRSGNHWMRYLLEGATHIATGSVYLDKNPYHIEAPFPWGGYSAPNGYQGNCRYPGLDDIVIVKTHYPAYSAQKYDKQPYIKVVRIIRHPVDCFYSLFLYKGGRSPQSNLPFPTELVREYIKKWKEFQNYWNQQDNVLTVRYEDLLEQPVENLDLVLNAIGYNISRKVIKNVIKEYPPQGHELKHIDCFSTEDLQVIKLELQDLMDQYNYKL